MKVKNMVSHRGNSVANQFVIKADNMIYFQSYESICAKLNTLDRQLTFGSDWDYSRTTLKYLYIWMEEYAYRIWSKVDNKPNIRKALQELIDNGIILYDESL